MLKDLGLLCLGAPVSSVWTRIFCFIAGHRWILHPDRQVLAYRQGPPFVEVVWFKRQCVRCGKPGPTAGARIFVRDKTEDGLEHTFDVGSIES